jgi:FKBP-type peptidyl-prolyl cis-trans isomerase
MPGDIGRERSAMTLAVGLVALLLSLSSGEAAAKLQNEPDTARHSSQLKQARQFLEVRRVNLSGMRETRTGLWIVTTQEGNGTIPALSDKVAVRFTGWRLDGTRYERLDPIEQAFDGMSKNFDGMLKGATEGLLQMSAGEVAYMVIPPQIADGVAGNPPGVPVNRVVVTKVELLEVVRASSGEPGLSELEKRFADLAEQRDAVATDLSQEWSIGRWNDGIRTISEIARLEDRITQLRDSEDCIAEERVQIRGDDTEELATGTLRIVYHRYVDARYLKPEPIMKYGGIKAYGWLIYTPKYISQVRKWTTGELEEPEILEKPFYLNGTPEDKDEVFKNVERGTPIAAEFTGPMAYTIELPAGEYLMDYFLNTVKLFSWWTSQQYPSLGPRSTKHRMGGNGGPGIAEFYPMPPWGPVEVEVRVGEETVIHVKPYGDNLHPLTENEDPKGLLNLIEFQDRMGAD